MFFTVLPYFPNGPKASPPSPLAACSLGFFSPIEWRYLHVLAFGSGFPAATLLAHLTSPACSNHSVSDLPWPCLGSSLFPALRPSLPQSGSQHWLWTGITWGDLKSLSTHPTSLFLITFSGPIPLPIFFFHSTSHLLKLGLIVLRERKLCLPRLPQVPTPGSWMDLVHMSYALNENPLNEWKLSVT